MSKPSSAPQKDYPEETIVFVDTNRMIRMLSGTAAFPLADGQYYVL